MFHVTSVSVPSPLLPVKCRFGCSTGTCHLLNLPAFIFCSSRTKALVLELLAAVCLVRGGHEIILSAFDNFKEVRAAPRVDLRRPVCHYILSVQFQRVTQRRRNASRADSAFLQTGESPGALLSTDNRQYLSSTNERGLQREQDLASKLRCQITWCDPSLS